MDEPSFSPVQGLESYHEDPAFQEWFGNSVTHREGVPVTYYTGTSKDTDFNKFNVGRHGAWFTADPAEASQYAVENDSMGHKYENQRFIPTNTASRVIPAHLKIENPYTGPLPDWSFVDNYKKAQSDFFDVLRSKGYDGWIPEEHGGKLAVVLKEPHQIKTVHNRTWDPKNPRMDKAEGGEVEDDGITAYHGSPHDFDEFDLSKIGTGEGAQAYGHGLYFAEAEPVAKGYRDRLSDKQGVIDASIKRFGGVDEAIDAMKKTIQEYQSGYYTDPFGLTSAKKRLEQLERHKAGSFNTGRMYEVRINAHPDHFLDWDKPLSEQPHVEAAIGSYLEKKLDQPGHINPSVFEKFERGEMTGADAVNLFGADTKPLVEAGIKGVKYLDAGSRGAGEGSRNYVVFDDKLVNVKRKYADGGVVEENDHGEEKYEDRAAGGKAAGQRSGWASSVKIGERSPVVDRALMVVSRKA